MVLGRNEVFRAAAGRSSELERVLNHRRDQYPEIFREYIPLSHLMGDQDCEDIDPYLFAKIVGHAYDFFGSRSPEFKWLPFDRYLVRKPSYGEPGGFHGLPLNGLNPGGYFCYEDLGYGTLLNRETAPDIRLRTIELARNYLHDMLHASTFRSIHLSEDGNVHRVRYGLNARGKNGVSFSSVHATPDGKTVNLNILMEGLIQKLAGKCILECCPEENAYFSSPSNLSVSAAERRIWEDIVSCRCHDPEASEQMKAFHDGVMGPTERFLEYWSTLYQERLPQGVPLEDLLLTAMMSGSLDRVHSAYDIMLYGEERNGQAWNTLFRQPNFQSIAEPPAEMQPSKADDYICLTPFGYF